jgi:hypothetical protein
MLNMPDDRESLLSYGGGNAPSPNYIIMLYSADETNELKE